MIVVNVAINIVISCLKIEVMKILIKVLAMCTLSSVATSSNAKQWSFELEPYLMATSIDGDGSVGRINSVPVDVDFDTILNNLDSAAMLHFEAMHQSGWGVALDYGYMNLGNTKHTDHGSSASASVRQGVFEGVGIYRTKVANGSFDYFAGFRWWDNDLGVDINVNALPGDGFNHDVKSDWIDPVVGMRWLQNIDDDWSFFAQADIGGMGIGSDFTASVQTGVQYEISELMTLDMKYRATWVDYEEGQEGQVDYYQYDSVTHGLIAGLIFKF